MFLVYLRQIFVAILIIVIVGASDRRSMLEFIAFKNFFSLQQTLVFLSDLKLFPL